MQETEVHDLARRQPSTLSGGQLRELFQSLLGQAKSLHGQHAGAIQAKARSLNPAQLLEMVRGR